MGWRIISQGRWHLQRLMRVVGSTRHARLYEHIVMAGRQSLIRVERDVRAAQLRRGGQVISLGVASQVRGSWWPHDDPWTWWAAHRNGLSSAQTGHVRDDEAFHFSFR